MTTLIIIGDQLSTIGETLGNEYPCITFSSPTTSSRLSDRSARYSLCTITGRYDRAKHNLYRCIGSPSPKGLDKRFPTILVSENNTPEQIQEALAYGLTDVFFCL